MEVFSVDSELIFGTRFVTGAGVHVFGFMPLRGAGQSETSQVTLLADLSWLLSTVLDDGEGQAVKCPSDVDLGFPSGPL